MRIEQLEAVDTCLSVISIVVCCSPLLVLLFCIMGPSKVLACSCNPVHNRYIVLLRHIFSVHPSQTKQSSKASYDTVCVFSMMICSRVPCAVPGPERPKRGSQDYPFRQIKVTGLYFIQQLSFHS